MGPRKLLELADDQVPLGGGPVEGVEVRAGLPEHSGQVRQGLVVQGGEQVVQSVLPEVRHHQEVVAVNVCAVYDGLQLEYSPVCVLTEKRRNFIGCRFRSSK